jgi:hypothetical protein
MGWFPNPGLHGVLYLVLTRTLLLGDIVDYHDLHCAEERLLVSWSQNKDPSPDTKVPLPCPGDVTNGLTYQVLMAQEKSYFNTHTI